MNKLILGVFVLFGFTATVFFIHETVIVPQTYFKTNKQDYPVLIKLVFKERK